ncbi:uncharacterized protein LOC143298784 isoform X2 [Babylonia areolata]|uniref:uncharacterized protein LOC143298784 isoform X2 n=1 Tax=Babylonia areolata TaxID=304850 RepID=UPI003FCFC1E8
MAKGRSFFFFFSSSSSSSFACPAVVCVCALLVVCVGGQGDSNSGGDTVAAASGTTGFNAQKAKPHLTQRASTSSAIANATVEEEGQGGEVVRCSVWTKENIHDFIYEMEEERHVNLFKFRFRFEDPDYKPFENNTGRYYKPYLWYRTRSQHGRTLLMLSFHYDVLSMTILTIGVTDTTVELQDGPAGCFGRLTPDSKMTLVRRLLLSRTDKFRTSYATSTREEYVCNQMIKDNDGYAEFVHDCCMKTVQGDIKCSSDDDDKWITILYFSITMLKVLMFLFSPSFLPQNMYSAMYVAAEYIIKLKKELKLKLFVSERTDANVRCKHRLTLEEISEWHDFRNFLDTLPMDEIVPVKMAELRVKVKGKRIIPENEPPTGLLRTIYDNLGRCKIKQLDAFRDCCETSIYASMEHKFRHQCTWHSCVEVLVKAILLLMVPIPFYARLYIYYSFEHGEMQQRRTAMARVGLRESFDLYRTNVIQYFSPFHGIFIATYCFYFLAGIVIGFSSYAFREKLKSVARSALQDMSNVSQTGVLGVIIRTLLFPYRKCGLLAFLLAPFYGVVVTPLLVLLFALYCIPTLYLSHRVPFHARKLIGLSGMPAAAEARKWKHKRIHKLRTRISQVDRAVHREPEETGEDSCCSPDSSSFRGLASVREFLLQVACSLFCLCILYSVSLIFAESAGLIIEVLAFTMMGIIVNAGSVLKYVSMVLLVFVYMHDCYNNVYLNYLTFNKTIIDDMIDRTTEDLRKIASMPSSQQANAAFQVKCVDEEDEIQPQLNFEKNEIRWKVGQLLLFLDSHDTPRIPLRFFQKLCQVRVHGAPGPVYINLLAATGKFMIIVVFLMFVMIVVMAFGNVMAMSSTNTTLATLAGGFVPMLLKNVLSSKGAKLSLKSISFKGQVDEIISTYKQYWPVLDLVTERDLPEEEDNDESNDNDNNDNNDNADAAATTTTTNTKDGSDKDKDKGGGGGNGDKGGKDKDKKDDKKDDKDSKKDKKDDKGDGKDKSNDLAAFKKKKASTIKADADADDSNGADGKEKKKKNGEAEAEKEDENLVDLFVDLSVADTAAGWSIYGSSESLPDPEHSFMPAYFNTDQFYVDRENNVGWRDVEKTYDV